ncbi:tyrosine-protein phosphatase [Stackebrandtia nassauensis]|uniref:Protein tyrosine/serine phosphatase n=1 Tax=Stackebrandtia nassauensis (strain DSM 44728 / CIP 108903 / NRRL B-16338 / NBRC 102104 / LLR-40K-21) TaxID=446470 RepID=D3Q8Q6_STANL|nr:tyrosine-protein phosphatase [Stackebrandtia nassauensis]ADD44498.1 protein tyrosine/serine phosphatase [Stackebrandtia nassauensis DSM 44728]
MSDTTEPKLSGSPNLRDLGGYRTGDGRRTRHGLLYRSGSLATLSDADVETLAGMGLRAVVDFRLPGEVSFGGADRLPEGLTPVSLPVGGGSLDGFYSLAKSGDWELINRALGDGKAHRSMIDVYRGFVSKDDDRAGFAAALRRITEGDALPLLFHCTAGKDRTGWLAAIVLKLVGVTRVEIFDDFLLSDLYFLPSAIALMEGLGVSRVEAQVFRPLLSQDPKYLEAAFAEAEGRYGSFEGFVHKGLGVGPEAVERLRSRLLEPDSA